MIIKSNSLEAGVVLLIMALAFSIPFGEEYGRIVLIAIVVLWLFMINKENILEVFETKVFLAFTFFILIHILSLLWSENIHKGIDYIKDMLIFMYLPILIFVTIVKKEHIKYILGAFVAGMFVNEIISYLIYFDLYETAYSKVHNYPVGFLNHIMYSVLVAFAAILILYQAKNMRNIYLKIIYVIFFITMTTNLVISSGRTGYIVYFVSLFILLFTYYKLNIKNFLQVLVFPIMVFIIGYKMDEGVQQRVNASMTSIEKIQKSEDYSTSFGARIASYPIAYDILSQPNNSFLLGMGTGYIKKEIEESNKRTGILKIPYYHLHNYYLSSYVNAGVLALILLILIFYFTLSLKIKDKEMKFIQQLIIVNISIAILSDVILSINEGMMFFAIFISLLLVQEKYENKQNTEKLSPSLESEIDRRYNDK